MKPPPPPETEDGVSADDADADDGCAAAGPPMPMMGGSPGISGVLSRMLPGVPEEDLKINRARYRGVQGVIGNEESAVKRLEHEV